MIWVIAKRELFSNIITFWFLVGLILCLALMTASAFVFMAEYRTRQEIYDRNVALHIDEAKHKQIHQHIEVSVDRPPASMGFLCIGLDKELGNMVESISYKKIPREAVGGGSNNPLMSVFRSLDMALIIQVVLSLLTLLLAYDTISGEREQGTLSLTLSNPVPRHHILLGKLLGGMISISLPLVAGILVGLIVILTSGLLALQAQAWARIVLVFLCSLLYLSAIFMLGILISTRTRKSATSLVILLFLWVALAIVLPNMGPYIARHPSAVRDKAAVEAECEELEAEFGRQLYAGEYAMKLSETGNYPPERWRFLNGRVHHSLSSYPREVFYAPRESMVWYLEGIKHYVPLHMHYADMAWEVYHPYEEQLRKQMVLSNNISRASTSWIYYNAASILAGTDSSAYMHFMDQARRYRQELIDYSLSHKGFSSLSFFTRMKMDETLTYAQLAEMESRQGREAIEELMGLYEQKFRDAPSLQGVPTFRYQPESLPESVERASPDTMALGLLNVVLFLAAYASFMKQEVK